MRQLLEIVGGFSAGVLFILLVVFVYGPSGAIMDFLAKLWRSWRGKRPSTND